MLSNFSRKYTDTLIKNKQIDESERAIYEYGCYILLSTILFFFVTIVSGFILQTIWSSIIFLISFMLVRRYAGGYHAKTEKRCQINSFILIIFCNVLIKLSMHFKLQLLLMSISFISVVSILALAPLDSKEKPLSNIEKKHYQKITYIILVILIAISIVTCNFGINLICVPICCALLLEGFLIILGKFSNEYF